MALPLKFIRAPTIIGVYHKGKKKNEKMLDTIKRLFRRKHTTPHPAREGQGERLPLRIEGVKPAPLTPQPDDAELAAQALLESLASPEQNRNNDISDYRNNGKQDGKTAQPRDAAYYHALADRIRTARTAEARLVMRLLASVEEQLAEPTALYKGQWGDTEHKLYRAMDIAEREGGELHRRWQHCLANVLVRRMEEEREAMEDGRRKMEDGSGDGTQASHLRDAERQQHAADETPSQNPIEGRPADTTLETSSQTATTLRPQGQRITVL